VKKNKKEDSSSSNPMDRYATDKHRKFYINGELFFSLFYDPAIIDKNKIISDFLESKDWKWYKYTFEVKEKNTSISKDLKEVYIETTKHREKEED
jgi:hypothetical protein